MDVCQRDFCSLTLPCLPLLAGGSSNAIAIGSVLFLYPYPSTSSDQAPRPYCSAAMNVDKLIFYSEPPLNDGADEVRDDVELFSSIRDDEIDSSIMLLECLSGTTNRSQDGADVMNENEHNEELEERLAAIANAVDLHEQISTNKPPEMQYFSHTYGEGTSFGAMDDEASVLIPIVTPNKVPSTLSRSGGLTLLTSSSPTISTVAGSKPHTPRRISLRSPMALTPKRKISKPFAFNRNGSVGKKGPGHIPFTNENEDGEKHEPPEEKGSKEEKNNVHVAYILVDGTWVSPLAQKGRDEPKPKSKPETKLEPKPEPEPFASAKNATNTSKVDRRKKTLIETKTAKRADTASPSRLQESKRDIGSRQRVKITVTDAAVPRNPSPTPTPTPDPDPATTPAPIPAASPTPDSSSIALESDSQKSSIATSTPTTVITERSTEADQNPMLGGDDEHNKNLATKHHQQEIEDKPDGKSSESIEKLRRVYSRTLEIVKDLSKSEAEHEIIRMLNQNIGRAFGSPTGSAQTGREAGTSTNPTENTKSVNKGIPVATGGPTKKSSIQTTTGKKMNVSFNLSEDIRYFIQENISSASSRNDSSSSSDGSNGDNIGSSASVVSEDHTYDSYSSISTFGADHDACGKVNEILSEIRHIADAFNIFNEDRNSVGAEDFSASTADISLESEQEQIRAAMSEAFSFRRKVNMSFPTSATTSSPPLQNQ